MSLAEQHFARVTPIVGAALGRARVGLIGCADGAEVAALLAASGVLRWALAAAAPAAPGSPLARRFGPAFTRQAAHSALAAALRAHHGERLPWAFVPLARVGYDLLIAAGEDVAGYALAIAARRGCPLVLLPAGPRPDPASWAAGFPVARLPGPAEAYATPDPYAAAALARAILLRGTPHARPDLEALLAAAPAAPEPAPPAFRTPLDAPALRRGTALVAGLGSLGSFAALELARAVGRLVLADGGAVAPANPARQLYRSAQVGRPKAAALAEQLRQILGDAAPELVPVEADLRHEEVVAGIAAREGAGVAVLATGTVADFALARGLRAAGVPHLAARCYPRARFWEAVLVPGPDAPCLGCLRGQLYAGPTPPPTPEEAARYAAPGDLQAEPATLVESGWAAACAGALAVQLLAPPGLREAWAARLLAGGRTCLIGGAYVVGAGDGPAYGIARPGQVRAFGVESIVGSAAERICADCGRTWPVGYLAAE